MTKDFVKRWAEKAWKLEGNFIGTMSGGIDPPKHLLKCEVIGIDTVEFSYDLPETGGYSDVIYHTVDPHRVRKDTFFFTNDGQILMNGSPFPSPDQLTDEWTEAEAKAFVREFKAALEDLNS